MTILNNVSLNNLRNNIPDSTLPILSGCATFGMTLALSTATQKFVGISTATKILPTVNGIITVCIASLISERAAIFTHEWQKYPNKSLPNNVQQLHKHLLATSGGTNCIVGPTYARRQSQNHPHFRTSSNIDDNTQEISGSLRRRQSSNGWYCSVKKLPMHEARVCLLGLLTFKLLGGRFWAISPSSYTHLGSFARWSIPCTENYATANQRLMIEQMGRKWGCHTCGSHMISSLSKKSTSFKFVGDHMPPKSVAEQINKSWLRRLGILPKVQFRFYPQCVSCSNTQGSILSKATNQLKVKGIISRNQISRMAKAGTLMEAGGGQTAYFHGWRFRINHLAGGVLAASTVVGATDREIAKGNPKRLQRWQSQIEKSVKKFTK